MNNPVSYRHVVVWRTLICAANRAPFGGSEGVWTTVPKWVTASLLDAQSSDTFSGCRSRQRRAHVFGACSHVWRSMV